MRFIENYKHFLKDEIFHIRSKYLKWFPKNKLDSVHQRGMGHVDDKSEQRLQSIKKNFTSNYCKLSTF